MKKILFLLLLSLTFTQASVQVVKASKTIKYKDLIDSKKVFLDRVDESKIKRFCKHVTKKDIINNTYYAKKHMKKGYILCLKDLYKINSNTQEKVIFNFGSIEIEKSAKLIRETKDYVKIKNQNGKIEKIYKDGSLR